MRYFDTSNIPDYQQITILGFSFECTVVRSNNVSGLWQRGRVQESVAVWHNRDQCLQQHVLYTHIFLLSRIGMWHKCFPHTARTIKANCNTDIMVHMAWSNIYMRYQDITFRVRKGRMDLTDFAPKCIRIFLLRCKTQSDMFQSLTTTCFGVWAALSPMTTHPPPYCSCP